MGKRRPKTEPEHAYAMSTARGAEQVDEIVTRSLGKPSRRHARNWARSRLGALAQSARFKEASDFTVRYEMELAIKRRFKPKLKRDWIGLAVRSKRRISNGNGAMPAGTIFEVKGNKAGLALGTPACTCCEFEWFVTKVSEMDVEIVGIWEDHDPRACRQDPLIPAKITIAPPENEAATGNDFKIDRGGAYTHLEICVGDGSEELLMLRSEQYLRGLNVQAMVYVLEADEGWGFGQIGWGFSSSVDAVPAFHGRFDADVATQFCAAREDVDLFVCPTVVAGVKPVEGSVPFETAGIMLNANDAVIAAISLCDSSFPSADGEQVDAKRRGFIEPHDLRQLCFETHPDAKTRELLRTLLPEKRT